MLANTVKNKHVDRFATSTAVTTTATGKKKFDITANWVNNINNKGNTGSSSNESSPVKKVLIKNGVKKEVNFKAEEKDIEVCEYSAEEPWSNDTDSSLGSSWDDFIADI